MSNIQLVEKVDAKPTSPLILPNEHIAMASMNPDLTNAEGSLVLVKKALKAYIDNNVSPDSNLLQKFLYTISDLVETRKELENDYRYSDKPVFFDRTIGGIRINTNGMIVEYQNNIVELNSGYIHISNDDIQNVLDKIETDFIGADIVDSRYDDSEETKFMEDIKVNFRSDLIYDVNESYQYFITENKEIIYGYIDTFKGTISEITRGNITDETGNYRPLETINDRTMLYMTSAIRVYLDLKTNEVKMFPSRKVFYLPLLNIISSKEYDTYFTTIDKKWTIYLNSNYMSLPEHVYLGDLIYYNNEFIGFNHSDVKWIMENISNIELLESDNVVYTNSNKTFLTVLDKFVEFTVDRMRWDLNICSENGTTVYLYIDSDGKTWVDYLRPKYIGVLGYYKHYYHYWRCVGEATYNNGWNVKEI